MKVILDKIGESALRKIPYAQLRVKHLMGTHWEIWHLGPDDEWVSARGFEMTKGHEKALRKAKKRIYNEWRIGGMRHSAANR